MSLTWNVAAAQGTSCPAVMELGDVGSGIAAIDTAQGLGWLMWSEADVHTRFNPSPHVRAASHVIAVVYEGGSWQVDSGSVLTPFTPHSTDCLLAEVDFTNDTVESLQGSRQVINGIDSGFAGVTW